MTGRELQEEFARLLGDQSRSGDPARGRPWDRLTTQEQIAWEDLAAWLEKQT